MSRLYFYVVDVGQQWTLKLREEPAWSSPVTYASQEAAVEAASRLARHEWETHGRAAGVRVPTSLGGWRDERIIGDAPVESGPFVAAAPARPARS